MPRLTRLITVVLATAVLTAGSVTVASAGSSKPTPKQWAKGVCSSISTWIGDVEDTIQSLGDEGSLEDTVNAAADGIKEATDDLVTSLDDLGLPQTKNAKQAKQAVNKLGDQLDNDLQKIERLLDDLGNDPVDIASTFADIGTVVQKAIDQVKAAGDTLQGLDRNGELQKALKSSPACKELERSF